MALFLLLGGLVLVLAKASLDQEMGRRLVAIAQAAASQMPEDRLMALQPGDENTHNYQGLAEKLARLRVMTNVKKIYAFSPDHRSLVDTDPTAHAEMIAIREASVRLGRWRLSGATLYVTVEPCVMCAGAIILARLDRVVFGAPDPKAGAMGSLYSIHLDNRLNHRVEVVPGVLAADCSAIIKKFFEARR